MQGLGLSAGGGWSQRYFMQMMQFCLKVLEEWCKEWAVEVNMEKWGDAYQEERC